jgi:hypothetical protein
MNIKSKISHFVVGFTILATSMVAVPAVLFAQGTPAGGTGYCATYTGTLKTGFSLKDLIDFFTCFIGRTIVPLIFAIALVVFLWGVIKFMQAKESSEKEEGRQFMIWGIIALTVMISIWGLTSVLGGTFHVNNIVPQLKVAGSGT